MRMMLASSAKGAKCKSLAPQPRCSVGDPALGPAAQDSVRANGLALKARNGVTDDIAAMHTIPITRLQRSENLRRHYPGRWPGLLHFAPLALRAHSTTVVQRQVSEPCLRCAKLDLFHGQYLVSGSDCYRTGIACKKDGTILPAHAH
jgi:hypothetical protein